MQSYLRAGRYRVTVAAKESFGRAGIVANPAPLLDRATLVPGGSVRAALPAGSGAAFPIEIAEAGNYHLDLLGLGREFTARLEDAEGWPILPAGDLSSLDRTLSPGRYRVLVLPIAVDARVIARLARKEPEAVLEGHGPHPLLFDAEQHFQWREPPGRDDPRPPDQWEFALAGPAHVTIDIGDGMVGDLRRADDASSGPALARLVYKSGFAGELPAGRYRIDAASLGRNDRLDYKISLRSDELQPGRPRPIALPATVPFAIGRDRVVSLTSFGNVDVKAVCATEGAAWSAASTTVSTTGTSPSRGIWRRGIIRSSCRKWRRHPPTGPGRRRMTAATRKIRTLIAPPPNPRTGSGKPRRTRPVPKSPRNMSSCA